MKLLPFRSVFVVLITLVELRRAQFELRSPLREQYDGYGDDWIFMPDGNGKPQVAILKGRPDTRSNILDDQSITYILYTRYKHR